MLKPVRFFVLEKGEQIASILPGQVRSEQILSFLQIIASKEDLKPDRQRNIKVNRGGLLSPTAEKVTKMKKKNEKAK